MDKIQSHVHDLSLKQSCPYIEFLLRWMDMKHIDGKRWFLSVVDMARIPMKKKEDKKEKKKK